MKNICVFCSANDVAEMYVKSAQEFAYMLAVNGYNLVWGGSDTGIMKVVADSVKSNSRKIIGISMELLKSSAKKDADEMIVAKDLRERKRLLLQYADAFVVLVGGTGTLDEVSEVIELKKLGLHTKPIIFLNTEKFYDGLKIQLQKMKSEGMIKKELDDLFVFVDTPKNVIDYINRKLR